MAELETFPQTPFIDDLPLDSTGIDLLRTAYLVEDYAQGNPWMRTQYREVADLSQFGKHFSDEQIAGLLDSVEGVNRLVRNGVSELLLVSGGLIPENATPKARSKQLKAADETWSLMSGQALGITAPDPTKPPENEAAARGPLLKETAAVAYAGLFGSGMALLDIRSMQNHQAGKTVGRPESTMRENVLAGRPAGSVAFDPFFKTMNGAALKVHIFDESLRQLEVAWQAVHPDEAFYPTEFAQQAAAKQSFRARMLGKTGARTSKLHAFSAARFLDL